jgi:hypothetical protein
MHTRLLKLVEKFEEKGYSPKKARQKALKEWNRHRKPGEPKLLKV